MAASTFWEPTLRKANERAAAFLERLGVSERTSQAAESLNGWKVTVFYDLPPVIQKEKAD